MDFLFGALTTLIVSIVLFLLNASRERKNELFRRELDRIFALEEFVGEVVEWVGGFQLGHDEPELQNRMRQLAIKAGQFRRYPTVKQALRDIHNRAGILLVDRREHHDFREAQKELEEKYQEFIKAIDSITGKRKT